MQGRERWKKNENCTRINQNKINYKVVYNRLSSFVVSLFKK